MQEAAEATRWMNCRFSGGALYGVIECAHKANSFILNCTSNMKILPAEFDGQSIRRVFDETTETWWFSVIDVVQVLTMQSDDLTARKYWNQLKRRLAQEGSQLVTNCHQLKMTATDGKQRLTDVATAETLLRLVQSVPSP